MIRIQCPKCDALLNADDSRAGTAVRCPKCGQGFRLPAAKGGKTPDRPGPKPPAPAAGATRKKPRPEDEEDFASDFEIVDEEAPPPKSKPRPPARKKEEDELPPPRPKVRPRDEEEDDEDEEERTRRPKRKKKKRRNVPGRNTLLTLVGIDVGASLLLGILVLTGTILGVSLLSLPLAPIVRLNPMFMLRMMDPWVLGTMVLVRGLVGAGLGFSAYLGQDLARFAHALLLLAWAALAGIGFILGVVDMIRFASTIGFSGQALLYLLLALLWQAGHAVLGFQFLWNPDVQNYVTGQGERS